ncbi:hypothetical protein CLAVI_000301 [Candidatus Clavichlamydia salmonicola]|uniref:hypothetical protein n=1 Tax=Candidatus Clavichlamydia salmonicola TaxID=469812 RepID=UPI001891B297|nr:hypothetical protein [Candidatus Clavichlamydia salmonicola]MBF5050686.1 hypothetical protein [Candidatus Clavichlamydia salmonicola]
MLAITEHSNLCEKYVVVSCSLNEDVSSKLEVSGLQFLQLLGSLLSTLNSNINYQLGLFSEEVAPLEMDSLLFVIHQLNTISFYVGSTLNELKRRYDHQSKEQGILNIRVPSLLALFFKGLLQSS